VTQHASLTAERWARFSRDQQVLMISNEMNRASRLLTDRDDDGRRLAYERVLRLVDLSAQVSTSRTLRRELLRWRDLVAALYIAAAPDPGAHHAAMRSLLQLTPAAAAQIPHVGRA
jgi:hypothetical protein